MPTVRELSEQLWTGQITTQEYHPVAFSTRAGEEIADGVLFYKGIASANTIDTGDGLVMLDTGAVNDTQGRVTVVLDAAMMEHELLNYHPLDNTMTTSIRRDDLVKFLESTGHSPRIEPVAGPAPEAD